MIEIKETTAADVKNLQRLWADGDVMRFVGFPDGLHETDEAMQAWLQEMNAGRPAENHYSIYEDGEYCGEAGYCIDRAHGGSTSLDVKLFAFARGRGVAAQALSHAIAEAVRNGAETLWVDPDPHNAKAIALYERLGFRRKEMPAHVIASGEDPEAKLYMELCGARQNTPADTRRTEGGGSMQPVFESERIRFVEVSELLAEDYLVMVNDMENVERFLGGPHEPYTAEQEIAWVRSKREEKARVYSMLEKKSGRFIGNIELMEVNDTVGELGIAITGEMQDLGYGTEAVSALTAFGMERFGLQRIVLRVDPENARAIRVYEKCGFREYARTDADVSMEIGR